MSFVICQVDRGRSVATDRTPFCRRTSVPLLLLAATCESFLTVDLRRCITRSWQGDVAFVLFALTQLLDGVFTYVGIVSFGHGIEANPLIAWYVTAYGAATALAAAKLMALGCGAVLHFTAMHRTVSVLAAVYVAGALWPWIQILWL